MFASSRIANRQETQVHLETTVCWEIARITFMKMLIGVQAWQGCRMFGIKPCMIHPLELPSEWRFRDVCKH